MTKILAQAAVIGLFAFLLALAALSLWRSHNHPSDATPVATRAVSQDLSTPDHGEDKKDIWDKASTVTSILLALVALIQIVLVLNANESARISANAAVAAANASSKANDLSRQTLIADQRPWIAVSIEPAGPITWANGGMQVPFKVTLKNIGKSPALRLRHIEAMVLDMNADLPGTQVTFRQMLAVGGGIGAINLMPGDEAQLIVNQQADAQNVERSSAAWAGEGPKLVVPVIVGSADYYTQFDTNAHTTGFIYEIGFWDPAKGVTVTAMDPVADGDISQDRVRIRRRFDVDALVD
ncbi:hypothetical protein [Paraburkholderia strydomiana]|uniref:hypothetical protein n=1 Tax=Paraburkholderia strydomiana TaxID=1245417 RepID=UPI001BE96B53|nr:hypothetical protein [Paraburkholderia strydomiana]MBT2795299.1 hypothetical protein [Paraburkholderia strydomiana]